MATAATAPMQRSATYDGFGELGVPGDVGVVEVVLVGIAVEAVRDERPEVHERDGADERAHDGERAHAHLFTEETVEALDHGTSLVGLRRTVVRASCMLRQVVTVAS